MSDALTRKQQPEWHMLMLQAASFPILRARYRPLALVGESRDYRLRSLRAARIMAGAVMLGPVGRLP